MSRTTSTQTLSKFETWIMLRITTNSISTTAPSLIVHNVTKKIFYKIFQTLKFDNAKKSISFRADTTGLPKLYLEMLLT